MAPSADYNAGESVLAVGGTVAPITPVSGGGYTMEGGQGNDPEDDDNDPEPDDSASDSPKEEVVPIQIEVYEPFDAPGIEQNRKDYIAKLSTELNNNDSTWKKELDTLTNSYKEEYAKIRKDLTDEQLLYETIPSTVKTIICIKPIGHVSHAGGGLRRNFGRAAYAAASAPAAAYAARAARLAAAKTEADRAEAAAVAAKTEAAAAEAKAKAAEATLAAVNSPAYKAAAVTARAAAAAAAVAADAAVKAAAAAKSKTSLVSRAYAATKKTAAAYAAPSAALAAPSARLAAKEKATKDAAAEATAAAAKNPSVVNFLKTFQFLYTQGFFQDTSQSDLRLKKGVCVILYGLFTGDEAQDKILLYLFLKMKYSNKDMVYLLKTKDAVTAAADILGPSYVIYGPPIGDYNGIVFTEEEIDDKVKYNNYYKVSSGGSGPIEGPAGAEEDWKAWVAAMTLPITALWIDKKTQITLSKPGLEPVLLQKGECIQFKSTSDKTYDGIIVSFRFSGVDGPPTSIFLHRWHDDTKIYGKQREIEFTQIINKIKCNKTIKGSQEGGATTEHPLCTTLKEFKTSLDNLQFPSDNPSYITILRPGVKDRNPLICPDTSDSPFISKAFHSGEENSTYIAGDQKVKLLIDGKAYLIRIATEEGVGEAKGQVKANWENGIFSEGEADLLNDLQLTPPLLSTVFGPKWNEKLATFLDHISNPVYKCYSNVSIIPSRLCDHTRDFINRILREKYKEELHKKISKNTQPGVWPEEFTQIDKDQYTKGTDVVIVSASSGQAGFFQYSEGEKEKRAQELQALQEKYKDEYVILF